MSYTLRVTATPPRSTPTRAGGQEPLAARLRATLLRTSRRLRDQRSGAVSEPQLVVLAHLFRHGAMTPSELAAAEHVRPPTMTRILSQLGDAGLIRRSTHPDDGRQVLVEVTDTGCDLVVSTRRRRTEWLDRRLAALSPAERATLSEAEAILRTINSL